MKKSVLILLSVLLVLALAAGCGQNVSPPAPAPQEPEAPPGPFPLSVVDDTGGVVTIESEPRRIVSMIPSLTEILFALDLGEKVVGVTNWCNYPAAALDVEKIGDAFTPNAEMIISLEPDVVISPRGSGVEEILGLLAENGIASLMFDPKTMDAINETIIKVAQVAGVEERGRQLAQKLSAERQAFEAKVQKIDPAARPSVFVLLDTEYIFTVGDGEYLSEMIEAAGGRNAASGYGEGYPLLSEEILFELDPDIIICTFPMSEQVLAKAAWQELAAVKNGRVYDVDGDLVSRPGPRVVLGLEELYGAFFD